MAIDLGLEADQRAVGNLLEWQKGDGRARHRDVQEAHQSNDGGVVYVETSQQRGTKGAHDSYVGVKGAVAGYVVRALTMAMTVAAALEVERG